MINYDAGTALEETHLRKDAVNNAIGECVIAIPQQVFLAYQEIVVRVQLPEPNHLVKPPKARSTVTEGDAP